MLLRKFARVPVQAARSAARLRVVRGNAVRRRLWVGAGARMASSEAGAGGGIGKAEDAALQRELKEIMGQLEGKEQEGGIEKMSDVDMALSPEELVDARPPEEALAVANALFVGHSVRRDPRKAVELWQLLSERGVDQATFSLAMLLRRGGHGEVVADPEGAWRMLDSLASRDNPWGQYGLAIMLLNDEYAAEQEDRERRAFALMLASAQSGLVPPAKSGVADLYAEGRGVTASVENAVVWWTAGAEDGDPVAKYNLSLQVAEGACV